MAKKTRSTNRVRIRVGGVERLFTKSQIGRVFAALCDYERAHLSFVEEGAHRIGDVVLAQAILDGVCKEVNIVS